MVAGHLRERNGVYYIVLSYTDENGRRQTPTRSTGLSVKGNKKRAEEMLHKAQAELEEMLKYGRAIRDGGISDAPDRITFTGFLNDWLKMMKKSVEETTYINYERTVKKRIIPYFDKFFPKLLLVNFMPKHIQDYYTYEMEVNGVSANTVIHRHANIRKALQYAFRTGLLDSNPADKIQRPRKEHFEVKPYKAEELEALFRAAKGTELELAVILAAFYGLRRGEVCGLKWDAIDFTKKVFSIRHTVTQIEVDGKLSLVEKDRTKTKSSNRTLPLVKPFEELLLNLKEKQAINRRICGNSYCRDYLEYVYVNDMGELMKPNHITEAFPKLLERNGLRRIRFHDLRHSCASLLYANGVPLKDIQEWLGHSDIATTSNIYTHLDYSSKVASANAIIGYFPGSEEDKKDENGNAERIFLSSEMSSEKPKKPAVKAKTGAQKSKKPQEDTKKGRKTGTPVKGKK